MQTVMPVADANLTHGTYAVRRHVETRLWQRPCRGVVVLHNAPLTPLERDLVALHSSRAGSALSGATALRYDGLDGHDDRHHVTLPAGAKPPSWSHATVHYSHELSDLDVHPSRTPRRTRPARSVLDAAAWHESERYARWLVITALQAGLVSTRTLREALARRGHCRHRAVIVQSILDAAGGIQSVPEHDFSTIWRAAGLPTPTRQRPVRSRDGRYYLDVWCDALGFGVEVHGIPHLAVEQWDRDLERANEIVISGRSGLTFSSYAVRNHATTVMDQLDRMARAHGWEALPNAALLPIPPRVRRERRRRAAQQRSRRSR
ncbi:hypothetical protein [Aeromicrobium sp. CnD17-E]|uniref:hypothetical protein n=1 Tax=Aeromicrobium sp. CnD17-E TaxID=2954487 RepID=UPI0020975AB9|nr:hypothetical protein [Aeromicrobium sp. CnD17-E]MCO7239273.1 hypothetical protein [Aeromicrobium sp. CnD17-E]